jgi:hypothetical protein
MLVQLREQNWMLLEICLNPPLSIHLEILQGSFLTSISVIVIHTVFIVFPVVVIDLLVNVYSMADANKQLPTFKWIHIVDQQIGYHYHYG